MNNYSRACIIAVVFESVKYKRLINVELRCNYPEDKAVALQGWQVSNGVR